MNTSLLQHPRAMVLGERMTWWQGQSGEEHWKLWTYEIWRFVYGFSWRILSPGHVPIQSLKALVTSEPL